MFDTATYKARRTKLRTQLDGPILLLGNNDSIVNGSGNNYRFRQDSNFLYYIGLSFPGLAAIIDDKGECTLFGNEQSNEELIWQGPRSKSLMEFASETGISKVLGYDRLMKITATSERPHFYPPARPEHQILIHELFGLRTSEVEDAASKKLVKATISQRSIKSDEEISEIHKANTLTAELIWIALQNTKPGVVESDIVASMDAYLRSNDCRYSFPPIFTTDGHILHNNFYGNRIALGDLVLCDVGVETNSGHAGDLTRTFPATKQFTSTQKDVYSVVLDAYKKASNLLAPGVPYFEIHKVACLTLIEGLMHLGLMHGNKEEAFESGAHALFFPCGTGHMIGLDFHDMDALGEDYVGYNHEWKRSEQFGLNTLRLAKPLAMGNVVTVEPGIYFNPYLIESWKSGKKCSEYIHYHKLDAFYDFGGVRVENVFSITDATAQILGNNLPPVEITDIETIRD